MRLHVVSLPHTETTKEFATCAYTQKVVKFGKMMLQQGAGVFIYSGEENEAECTEHIPLFTKAKREGWFGEYDPNWTWGGLTWDPSDRPWQQMNKRAIDEIRRRAEPRDLILLIAGLAQKPIADALPALTACEWGIGYEGVFSRFNCYESYAWMHYLYGKYGIGGRDADGRWYDAVIPNFFDPGDFQDRAGEGGGYLLFLGRVTRRKGPDIAAEIAARLGMPLVIAGPGGSNPERGLVTGDGGALEIRGEHVSYTGPVGTEIRTGLLREAAALIAPTLYLEPFGGVAVEAMLSGTPAVTSDWGAFPETVEEGVTGYRFHRVQEGVEAVKAALDLSRTQVRQRATERYSLAAVGPQYSRWFERLDGLWDNDWYGTTAPKPLKATPRRRTRKKVALEL
jgi:glycosyltransferase involved in cell wall biosynthesis